jgi:glycosyltransferase involved in cell wall biosynthesis
MFKKLGHEIGIFAYWGLDSEHPINWEGIPIFTRFRDPWGSDIVSEHFSRFKADFLMPIYDIWVTPKIPEMVRTVAYSPTDHDPPAMFLKAAMEKCWKLIPYCEWAEKSLKDAGLKNVMKNIPHGVDTKLFKPIDKIFCRKAFGLKEDAMDAFIVGIVAGNYDKEGRKAWDKQLETLKIFRDQNPDCKLRIFLHTDIKNTIHGFDLQGMLNFFGLQDITYQPDPYYFIQPLPYEKMPYIYNMFDVHMLCSRREGFGLPNIESQACGVPNIGTDFSATSELTHPDLRVKVKDKIMTPILSWTAIPDSWDAAQKIEMLWKSPDKLEKHKKWSLEFAQKYDWYGDMVYGRWVKALDIIKEDLEKEDKNAIAK